MRIVIGFFCLAVACTDSTPVDSPEPVDVPVDVEGPGPIAGEPLGRVEQPAPRAGTSTLYRGPFAGDLPGMRLPDALLEVAGGATEVWLQQNADGAMTLQIAGNHSDVIADGRTPTCPCRITFDYRTRTVDKRLGKDGPFGKVESIQWDIDVLTCADDQTDGLAITVLTTVAINSSRLGEPFTEPVPETPDPDSPTVGERRRAEGKPTSIDALPRWFVAAHEIEHAEQIYEVMRGVVEDEVRAHRLCRPNKPTGQNRARIDQGFNDAVTALSRDGAGGDHDGHDDYPYNDVEQEAREAAWDAWDEWERTHCEVPLHLSCTNGCPGGFCCSDDDTPDGWASCDDVCSRGSSSCP